MALQTQGTVCKALIFYEQSVHPPVPLDINFMFVCSELAAIQKCSAVSTSYKPHLRTSGFSPHTVSTGKRR